MVYINKAHSRNKLAMVLSGGAAKGGGHLGVLKALKDAGVKPEIYAGTSVGAIISACMAVHKDIDKVKTFYYNLVKNYNYEELIDFDIKGMKNFKTFNGLIRGDKLIDAFAKEGGLGGIKFGDLDTELYITAVDYNTGKEIVYCDPRYIPLFEERINAVRKPWQNFHRVVFSKKDITLLEAIRASIAIPVIFKPLPAKGQYTKKDFPEKTLALLDGGVRGVLPFHVAALNKNVKSIIASNLGYAGQQKGDFNKKNIIDVFWQTLDIATSFDPLGKMANDPVFNQKNSPAVRIINPGLFNISMHEIHKSQYMAESARVTAKEVLGRFTKAGELDEKAFFKKWGEKEFYLFDPERWQKEKPGLPGSNIFMLTDLQAPIKKPGTDYFKEPIIYPKKPQMSMNEWLEKQIKAYLYEKYGCFTGFLINLYLYPLKRNLLG